MKSLTPRPDDYPDYYNQVNGPDNGLAPGVVLQKDRSVWFWNLACYALLVFSLPPVLVKYTFFWRKKRA